MSSQYGTTPPKVAKQDRQVAVYALRRPEIDLHKLSRALIGLAEQMAQEAAATPTSHDSVED